MGAETDAEILAAVAIDEVGDLLFQTGYRKRLSLEGKTEVCSALADYHLMAKAKGAMDQFIDGLNSFGLLVVMKQNPVLWEPLFLRSVSAGLTRGI